MMKYPIILSFVQAETLLATYKKGLASVEISPDLGLSTVTVRVDADGVLFPSGEEINWQQVEKIKKASANCFVVADGGITAIQVFSEETQRVCSLLPTRRTPSMLIAGFT